MVLDKQKAYKSLKKKGFIDSTSRSGDHKYLEYWLGGKMVLYTKLSHGSKTDLNDYLIKQMYEQCKLEKQQFIDLINCPLSADKYKEIIESKVELQ